jgi:hypothetical protein
MRDASISENEKQMPIRKVPAPGEMGPFRPSLRSAFVNNGSAWNPPSDFCLKFQSFSLPSSPRGAGCNCPMGVFLSTICASGRSAVLHPQAGHVRESSEMQSQFVQR